MDTFAAYHNTPLKEAVMRSLVPKVLAFTVVLCVPCTALAQGSGDLDAINRVIDQVFELEVAKDLTAQAELMSADRIYVLQGAGRRTDQAKNMQLQQAVLDQETETVPGIQWFIDARDRIIRFYGDGNVAVASFYVYSTYVLPADAPDDFDQNTPQPQPTVITWVFEKLQGQWKIVHTHISDLGPPIGQ